MVGWADQGSRQERPLPGDRTTCLRGWLQTCFLEVALAVLNEVFSLCGQLEKTSGGDIERQLQLRLTC